MTAPADAGPLLTDAAQLTTVRPPEPARPKDGTASVTVPPLASPRTSQATRLRARFASRAVRKHFGTVAGTVILGVLLWRLGTGVFLDGLRRIDAPTLLIGLGIGLLTTVFSAWRWCLVARGLGIRLPLGPAVADYYRALFLNAALPGGVVGDVHRAVRHGQSTGDLGRGVRAVIFERTAGQIALVAIGVPVLLTQPSPVLAQSRHLAELLGLAALGSLAIVAAIRMGRAPRPSRRGRALRAALTEARSALLDRRNWPGVLLSSCVVLAGHLAMFLVAARVAGSAASPAQLLPIALLALIAMGLPLNIGGWGPREGVTAWAFGAAGLGANTGLTVAVVYGVLSFVASLPGICVLVVRWYAALRHRRHESPATATAERPKEAVDSADEAVDAAHVEGESNAAHAEGDTATRTQRPRHLVPDAGSAPERTPHALRAPAPHASYPRSPPSRPEVLLTRRHERCRSAAAVPGTTVADSEVTKEKYGSKESTSPASSCFPFSAEASEGRPMTPDSV
ncbi:lysylphosphatidylglycerol synthase transmembrane domain-containing protein [Streptomyces avermitilis]|uniref:lysylphosphatidylglycerol synthase transmembrane domain-containing protein n=1 Tax=Streptomyces avermitilis TaxID=33903 RepID=UPI00339E2D29